MTDIEGILKEGDGLRELFPSGQVPLKRPLVGRGRGREGEDIQFYEVDLEQLDEEIIERILEKFREKGVDGTREQLFHEGYRILSHHFNIVPIPMRFVV